MRVRVAYSSLKSLNAAFSIMMKLKLLDDWNDVNTQLYEMGERLSKGAGYLDVDERGNLV